MGEILSPEFSMSKHQASVPLTVLCGKKGFSLSLEKKSAPAPAHPDAVIIDAQFPRGVPS
jgi:hypothetical protein